MHLIADGIPIFVIIPLISRIFPINIFIAMNECSLNYKTSYHFSLHRANMNGWKQKFTVRVGQTTNVVQIRTRVVLSLFRTVDFFSQLLCVMQSHQKCLGFVESSAIYLLQHWCRQRFDTMPKSHFRPMLLWWVIFQVWMNKCDSVKNDYNLYNLIMSIMAWNLCLSFHISIYFIEQLAFILIIWTCMRMLTGKYLCLYLYLFIHHKRLFDLF